MNGLEEARPSPALLPSGLRDLLPPEAEAEAEAVALITGCFASHGYERVEPPLLEFEDSLLAGSGAAIAEATFRMVDPESHRMMGLRPDMTPQVARIAATRLKAAPRPLRLAYAGQCVTLRGGHLNGDRQVPQAGIELIGVDLPDADAEIVAVGAEALASLGLEWVSFDLTVPQLAPVLLEEAGIAPRHREALLRALDRKDVAAVRTHGGMLAEILERLLLAAGPAARALSALEAAVLTPGARSLCDRLRASVDAILAQVPDLSLTIDPLEFRGWRYHTGLCMSVYTAGLHEELGRGGRYGGGVDDEPACGLTLFPAAILRAVSRPARRPRVYVPAGTAPDTARALRADGYATVAGLSDAPTADPSAEARRLLCTHAWRGAGVEPIEEEG